MQTRHVLAERGGNGEEGELGTLISVFLTPDEDAQQDDESKVMDTPRGQRLDGVLRFEPELVVVIESKVWEGAEDWQAATLDYGGALPIESRKLRVRWQDLLESWRRLSHHGLLGPAEDLLIQDLFDFAEQHFGQVLPFASLRMAGSDPDRRGRRLRAVLQKATRIRPEDRSGHVRLDEHLGTSAIQRVALDERDGEIVLSVWPGELKPQATYLYSNGRADRLASLDHESEWTVRPSPHLAFFTSNWRQRLYMHCDLSIGEYVRRWGGEDREYIGRWQPEAVRTELWPWLIDRGYADPGQDDIDWFLGVLGTRGADLRPGMAVLRAWPFDEAEELDDRGEFAEAVRDALGLVLGLADEPSLSEASTPEDA